MEKSQLFMGKSTVNDQFSMAMLNYQTLTNHLSNITKPTIMI
jgi:hypothetical protein